MKGSNSKSDVKAKAAFVSNLEARGFQNAKVISSPCDISAEKDGEQWYFEIKMTSHKDTYFGAATMTEWEQAFKTPERFRFVIAIVDEAEDCGFKFIEMTPEEMMQYSTIPPFKVYFNINLEKYYGKESRPKNPKKANGKRKAIPLTEAIFNSIAAAFKGIRS